MEKSFLDEVYRYLGTKETSLELDQKIDGHYQWLKENSQIKSTYLLSEMTLKEGEVSFETLNMTLKSLDLQKNLEGAEKGILGALTLGITVDRQLHKLGVLGVLDQLVLDACATAYIEEACEKFQQQILQDLGGGLTNNRYSPGYGDLALANQGLLLDRLETTKKLGLTLTKGYMMVPQKSVSFILGWHQKAQKRKCKTYASCEIGGECRYCQHPCTLKK